VSINFVECSNFIAKRLGSVDPSNFPDEEFELYSIPSYDRGMPEYVKGSEIGSTKQIVQPGDILLSKIVPHIKRCWLVGPSKGKRIIASGEWIVFRTNEIDGNYLKHVLVGARFHKEFMSTVSGVGGSLLRARPAFVEKIKIPVPSKIEQLKIAAALDEGEKLQKKRRQAVEKINSLSQAIFWEMFGDPLENSKKFKSAEIGECLTVQGGYAFKSDHYVEDGVRIVKISNVHSGNLTWTDIDRVPKKFLDLYGNFSLNVGDIVMALTRPIITSLSSVKIATIGMEDVPSLLNQRVARFQFPEDTCLLPEYFLFFCKSKYFYNKIDRLSSESLQPNVSTKQIEKIKILLPPLDLQIEFTNRINKLNLLLAKNEISISKCNKLFLSLQSRFFEVSN
jgi:type I restriction enzyme S subunit